MVAPMHDALVVAIGVGVSVSACSPGLSSNDKITVPNPFDMPDARPGVPPPADESNFRKLLASDLTSGGLWFPGADCQAQFGRAGVIGPESYDAFARCVATLHLRPTGRVHWLDDASVLTDDAGFEIEAHVADGKLDYIGFAGRAPGMPDLPTITPTTLESLRTAGAPTDTISADEADNAKPSRLRDNKPFGEYVRICLDETGALRTVMPGAAADPRAAAAFARVVRTWKFQPFVVAGTPTAVCAITSLEYPAPPRPPTPRLPKPPALSKAGNLVYNVSPTDLKLERVQGEKAVVPDDKDKIRLKNRRLIGSFKLCVDEMGRYEKGTILKSTEVPRYDAKLARAIMAWRYRPYLVDGKAIPFCTAATFIYTQK